MPSLSCTCSDCSHNKESCCCLPGIKVEGEAASNQSSTCCQHFSKESLGATNVSNFCGTNTNLIVHCNAQNCIHCDGSNKCTADNVKISYDNQQSQKNSFCKSFKS